MAVAAHCVVESELGEGVGVAGGVGVGGMAVAAHFMGETGDMVVGVADVDVGGGVAGSDVGGGVAGDVVAQIWKLSLFCDIYLVYFDQI